MGRKILAQPKKNSNNAMSSVQDRVNLGVSRGPRNAGKCEEGLLS